MSGPALDRGGALPGQAYEAARLRWASGADTERLLRLFRMARPEQPETVEGMRAWLEHGGALLLEDDAGEPLCALRWREEEDGWRVDRIATLPGARGQGYGRWLMTKVEALAIRYNVPWLRLTLDREDLLPYYLRLGYRPVDGDAEPGGLSAGTELHKRVGGTWQVVGSA